MEEKNSKSYGRQCFFRGVAVTCIVLAGLYFLSMWLPIGGTPSRPDSFQAQRKIKEIERVIENHYLGEVDEQVQTDWMCLGLVAALGDQYSTYYTKEEYEEIKRGQDGSYVGIGITIAQQSEGGELQIVECMEGSPAERAGIRVGDVIQSINGENVVGYTSSQAADLIQQAQEDAISLVLSRSGEEKPIEVTLVRENVESVSVKGEMLPDQVGYIKISGFTGVTASQFEKQYEQLQQQGMIKLIIDLRDNPGGLVDAVCDTLRQILPEGLIVYTEDKDGNRKERTCDGETPIDIPLVVLVNERSASASEIFAGAVKDHGIGTLVGTQTFGKGIVQNYYVLMDGSVVKLTVSQYFTPNGNNIHGTGIAPDVEVKQPESSENDVQKEKALEVLKGMS